MACTRLRLYGFLQMSHRVSSPLGVVDIAEANGGVEPLGVGIALVYKQPDSRDDIQKRQQPMATIRSDVGKGFKGEN